MKVNTYPQRISVVSYLNSKPFIYGLRNASFENEVEIYEDIPSVCADKLIRGEADLGLVPVAALPFLKNYHIISDYCIGADGPVSSVLLLSEVPLEKIKTILLDYQSRTSVMLTKVLAEKLWKIKPQWKQTSPNFENTIGDETSGVVIGDRALQIKNKFKYCYDLSAEWKKLTGLPFVFACWVSTGLTDKRFVLEFNNALKSGISRIDEIARKESNEFISENEIRKYLTECIDFNLDEKKKEAMTLFLDLISVIEN